MELSINKICIDCGVEKPLSEFHKRHKALDGRGHYCKPCACIKSTENRRLKAQFDPDYRERINALARLSRAKNPESYRNVDRKRYKRDRRKDWCRKYARLLVNLEIIARPTFCEDCKNNLDFEKLQGHHEDYTNPHRINWLCTKCHGLRHRRINLENKKK